MVIKMVAWIYNIIELSMAWVFMWSMRLGTWNRVQVRQYTSISACIHTCKSKCLRLATDSPWYVGNRQIHEDLSVPLFADHIRALTASFTSKIADVVNQIFRQLSRYLRWPRVEPVALRESQGPQGPAGHDPQWPGLLHESRSAALFAYSDWGFP